MKQATPATPPTMIAIHCLAVCEMPIAVEHADRRQQSDEMAKENDEDAEVKEIGAPEQLPAAQQLARAGAPGELLAIEAHPARDDEHRQAEIRIPAEHRMIEKFSHDALLRTVLRARW